VAGLILAKHRLSFTELHTYLAAHPDLREVPESGRGLTALMTEYGVLSRAVHGTGTSFRMRAGTAKMQLFTDDKIQLSMWHARSRNVLTAINQLLLGLYRDSLQGNRLLHRPQASKVASLRLAALEWRA
jgi:hypothetical protein